MGCAEGKNEGTDPPCQDCKGGYATVWGAQPPLFTCSKCTSNNTCNGHADDSDPKSVWSRPRNDPSSPKGTSMQCYCQKCND
eukprot:gene47423-33592_t